jgi:NADPH:quinone reductase-like Zn-dependent oxidoreductase
MIPSQISKEIPEGLIRPSLRNVSILRRQLRFKRIEAQHLGFFRGFFTWDAVRGFIVSDHLDRRSQFLAEMSQWIAEGRIKWKETIVAGIEKAPKAFLALFRGENFGKMLVKIGPDSAV